MATSVLIKNESTRFIFDSLEIINGLSEIILVNLVNIRKK